MKPLELVHGSIGQRVIVELRGGREYRGVLDGYDHPHLNLVLNSAEELSHGEKQRDLDRVIVRGDNIVYISP